MKPTAQQPNNPQENITLPVYDLPYVSVGAVSHERVTVNGVSHLVYFGPHGDKRIIGPNTQIVHLVDYYRVDEYGEVAIDEEGWSVSNGTCFVLPPEENDSVQMPAGTLYKVLDYAEHWGPDNIDPGTLAVRRVGYNYPKP
jgi:hypothetical protein